jgi:putative component of membrane protein insertase Oxa1/YidC/SpoIIIJ protein YidD
MAYDIHVDDELQAVAKDEMAAVMRCNAYAKAGHDNVKAYRVNLDGTKEPYDWFKAYTELCYG